MGLLKLAFNNAIDTATLTGDANANYPLANLKDGNPSAGWRPSTTSAYNGLRFRLSKAVLACVIAITNTNISAWGQVRFRAGLATLDEDYAEGVISRNSAALAALSPFAFGGGVNGTYVTSAGAIASGSTPRFDHDPARYVNAILWSEDLTQAVWSMNNGRAIDAKTVVFTSGTAAYLVQSGFFAIAGNVTVTAEVRLLNGSGDFRLGAYHDAGDTLGAVQTATRSWQTFSTTLALAVTGVNALARMSLFKAGGAGTLQVRKLRYSSAPNATYVKTTSARVHVCRGLLIEEARTNLLLWNRDLSNAAWTKTAASGNATATVAPDGSGTMPFLKEDATNAFHQAAQSITYTASASYEASWYMRPGVGTRRLQIVLSTATGSCTLTLNTVTWTVTVATAGTNPFTLTQPILEPGPFGTWRFGVIATAAATAGAGSCILRLDNGTGAAYAGDNTSGHWVWGGMLSVAGTPAITSMIPTTTATVTRTTDSATLTGAGFAGLWNANAGTLYAEFSRQFDTPNSVFPGVVSAHDGTFNNAVLITLGTNLDQGNGGVRVGGVSVADMYGGPITYGGAVNRTAHAFSANDFAQSTNGAAVVTDNSGAMPAGLTTMTIGQTVNFNNLCGHVRRLTYWPFRIQDSDLVAMSAAGPGAFDVDTGWFDALRMGFQHADPPADWGSVFDVMQHFTDRAVLTGSIEIYEPNGGGATATEIGRVFINESAFTPARWGTDYDGHADGWIDLSQQSVTRSGKKWSTVLPRVRQAAFAFPFLTQAEGDQVHEMLGDVGITEEVLLLPDPDDMARCQRYGFLGMLQTLNPLKYPAFATRANAFQMERKQ